MTNQTDNNTQGQGVHVDTQDPTTQGQGVHKAQEDQAETQGQGVHVDTDPSTQGQGVHVEDKEDENDTSGQGVHTQGQGVHVDYPTAKDVLDTELNGEFELVTEDEEHNVYEESTVKHWFWYLTKRLDEDDENKFEIEANSFEHFRLIDTMLTTKLLTDLGVELSYDTDNMELTVLLPLEYNEDQRYLMDQYYNRYNKKDETASFEDMDDITFILEALVQEFEDPAHELRLFVELHDGSCVQMFLRDIELGSEEEEDDEDDDRVAAVFYVEEHDTYEYSSVEEFEAAAQYHIVKINDTDNEPLVTKVGTFLPVLALEQEYQYDELMEVLDQLPEDDGEYDDEDPVEGDDDFDLNDDAEEMTVDHEDKDIKLA